MDGMAGEVQGTFAEAWDDDLAADDVAALFGVETRGGVAGIVAEDGGDVVPDAGGGCVGGVYVGFGYVEGEG